MPPLRTAATATDNDLGFMREALRLAEAAADLGEVPVGAILVRDGRILSRAFNLRETLHDPTAHAERLVLTQAGKSTADWRLDGSTLYVTLEPCAMCAGAIVLGRVSRLVYGAFDPKAGACDSLYRITSDLRLNHRVTHIGGVLEAESRGLLNQFFHARRIDRKNNPGRGA